ncbi:UBX domain-containing protein 7-like [Diadema antillarum]|uniref:UBX domain-containing protein 7-like n=1 Tax=Diadema antillarum TaxID=105358 RepID=UPI003A8B21A1
MTTATNKKDDMSALAETFASVTGATVGIGLRLLEVCNGDLQRAISMHLDGVIDVDAIEATPHPPDPQSAGPSVPPDDSVRAPIPSKRDTLLEDFPAFGPRPRQRRTRQSVFDGLRDFQAETRLQEEMIRNPQSSSKKRTLEDLFRPPLDLMHKGTFVTAREAGQNQGKWLMVNVQDVREFSCQKLNRDVWSDSTVRSIIREAFIFWQVYHDSEEGQRFNQFYKVTDFPYVSIIDPRTGEQMATWHKIDNESFCDVVMQFLSDHKMDVPDVIPLSPPADSPSSSGPAQKKARTRSIIDASEESQIEAAIAASLAEAEAANSRLQQEPKKGPGVISIASDSDDASDNEDEDDVVETVESDFAFSDSEQISERSNSVIVSVPSMNGASSSVRTSVNVDTNVADNDDDVTIVKTRVEDRDSRTNGQLKSEGKGVLSNSAGRNGDVVGRRAKTIPEVAKETSLEEKLKPEKESQESVDGDDDVEDVSGPRAKVMLRFPDGRRKQVCLSASSTLKALIKLISKEGFSEEKYELITNYPRRRLSMLDSNTSLSDAGLCPQESVFVQER